MKSYLSLFLLFSLLSIVSRHRPPANTYDSIRQSAQQGRETGAGAEDAVTLEPGKPISRELASGQRHTYQIKLSLDQFLQVIVEQQGIDLLVQVVWPDGKQIQEFDSE